MVMSEFYNCFLGESVVKPLFKKLTFGIDIYYHLTHVLVAVHINYFQIIYDQVNIPYTFLIKFIV